MHNFEALILLHYTIKVVNHSIKDKIYMSKRPTERMDNFSGGGVGVMVKSLRTQAPVILTILNYTVNNEI